MKLRKAAWLLLIPALIVLAAALAYSWLMHSESGARWLLSKLDSALPATVQSESLSGDLAQGLQLGRFRFDDGATLVDAGRLELAVNLDLFPPALNLETLHADSLAVRTLAESDQPADWDSVLPGLAPPLMVRFDDVVISGFEYSDMAGETVFSATSISAAGSVHHELSLDRLSVSLRSHQLAASGRFGLEKPYPLALEVQTGGDHVLQGSFDGNLESAGISLNLESPELAVNGSLRHLLDSPGWDLDITTPSARWPLSGDAPVAEITEATANSSGDWPEHRLRLNATLDLEELEPSRLELEGGGSGLTFSAQRLVLEGPELSLEATAEVSWETQPSVGIDARIHRLAPSKWLADWPGNQLLSGTVTGAWSSGTLDISEFNLAAVEAGLSADGKATVDLETGVVDADLAWTGLNWPLGSTTPEFSSNRGELDVSGVPEDWTLSGRLDLQAGDLPRGEVRLSGGGNLESMELTIHEASVLAGSVEGTLNWNWTGERPFSAALIAETIDVSPFLEQFPGVLSARLTASGAIEPLRLTVGVEQLEGHIRERPVSASGGLTLEHKMLHARDFVVRSGESFITVDGSPLDEAGMDFSIDIDSLAVLSDGFSGHIAGEGNLSLGSDTPRFSANLTGEELLAGPLEIGRIEVESRPVAGADTDGEFRLFDLSVGGRPMESLIVTFSGDEPLQQIVARAQMEGTNLEIGLRGALTDWADPLHSTWNGVLFKLELDHGELIRLSLDEEAAMLLGDGRISLEDACFSGMRDARMCLASSWRKPDAIEVSARLNSFPLGLVNLFVESDLEFSQVLSGSLDWSRPPGGRLNGNTRIDIAAGAVTVTDDDELVLNTGPSVFGFELVQGQLRQGELDLALPGTGEIDFDFNVPEVRAGLNSPIGGNARIDINNIGMLGIFFPVFDQISGKLDVDVGLSGILGDPAFDGSASLTDGVMENSASGFSFSEINLSGRVSELDRADLEGTFRAGEGRGRIETSISFEDLFSPVIDLALEGENLTVIEVPDLKVIANPDVELSWGNKVLEINGKLVIPTARVSPSYLPQSSTGQSEDIEIVAGELPPVEPDPLRDSGLDVRGSLEVELGEQVVVDLDLAEANITGTTKFDWQDGLIPIARGSYNVTGEIHAFGQLLRITRGRISFPVIPADNPHLNIRAEREIFGNSQIRRAGLMVAGTLRRPLIEAYTVPMTNKHRAQTLLVTGSDFDYDTGVGAVNVGTYILPRLFLSYGIGVFEDGNVISLRYDLGRGFGVKATSGQRETGIDLNYRIER